MQAVRRNEARKALFILGQGVEEAVTPGPKTGRGLRQRTEAANEGNDQVAVLPGERKAVLARTHLSLVFEAAVCPLTVRISRGAAMWDAIPESTDGPFVVQ